VHWWSTQNWFVVQWEEVVDVSPSPELQQFKDLLFLVGLMETMEILS
jgi:hypothetical protein